MSDGDQLGGIYVGGATSPAGAVTDKRRHANGDYDEIDMGYSGSFPWLVVQEGADVYNLHGTTGKTRSSDVVGTAGFPRVGDNASFAYIVWHDQRDGNYEIYLSQAYGSNAYADVRLTNHPMTSMYPDIATYSPYWWAVFEDNRAGNREIYLVTDYPIDPSCKCGDFDCSLLVDLNDVVYLLTWIFAGGSAPLDASHGDVTCDLKANMGDAVYLVNYIFAGGPAPCAACP